MKQSHIVQIALKDRDGKIIGHKAVIKYEGLLSEAHDQGLRSIHTELIQVPSKANDNVAIVRAVVVTNKGTFEAIGDASPANVNQRVSNALPRVAETRSKARALRDAVDAGMIALDELDDVDEVDAVEPATAKSTTAANTNAPTPKPEPPRDDAMTSAQRRLLFRMAAERGVPVDQTAKWLENVGMRPLAEFDKATASKIIEKLRGNANGHVGAAP